MAGTNVVKKYFPGGFYHIYNRGNNKERIFLEENDYFMFRLLLQRYLSEPTVKSKSKNYCHQIKLHAFCLMPNHYHLLVSQRSEKSIEEFMHSLGISYTMKWNKKHDRVGHTFQGVYRARLLSSYEDVISILNYIHRNPKDLSENPRKYEHSSLQGYLGKSECSYLELLIHDGIDKNLQG